ncbi:inhibitor of sigma-G Gin protein [Paenibacillus cellulosilyticus]|uniref:Inhibitor of sigma-G Gin protein n=1 Tax=Paenibacillus cellulosilyticus TaxID=375489 RepID=A0A2V2YNF1_9BACL|nr:sigma factor G inhibitor Gin [Paenibacillus cellulosilyticus]PWV95926.1 inhibitor of sigma-G Gin protein [Paenibacillus cellulosilyticus]QKS48402.1 sigma factor G inhibitor Gin [Paenibacillus cellulosilyticus]
MEEAKHTCKCIICGEMKGEDEGIRIVTEFICDDCEIDIVATDVLDEKYPFYIHQMKQIWIQRNA